jgi:anti-sigma factor RsiW
MQLQNFECQIAKAQIGRYVAGDALSEEALEQLEAHIGKCPDCKQNLAERRAVLQAMLSPGESHAEAQQDPPARKRFDLASFIKSKVAAKRPVHAAVATEAKPASFTKPALYSLALGAVLIGMSYLSKNVGSVLGPKAEQTMASAQSIPPTPQKQATVVTPPAPKSTPPKPTPHVTAKPEAKTTPAPVKKISSESHVTRSHKAPRHTENEIRVYAPEN